MTTFDGIWGCELLDTKDSKGNKVLGETIYTIDNTTKTRALFEINKGIGKIEGIDVNSKIAKEDRRVQFENMIYIADGPSDIPAFSVVNKNNGSTFAIYPHGDMKALSQVEKNSVRMAELTCMPRQITKRTQRLICGLLTKLKN